MSLELLERILNQILEEYINADFEFIEKSLIHPNIAPKEQVAIIRNMKIKIHSNDHEPPHFHVVSNDNKINAKFLIETGERLSGIIDTKDEKRILAFYQCPKTQIVLKKIWEKRY